MFWVCTKNVLTISTNSIFGPSYKLFILELFIICKTSFRGQGHEAQGYVNSFSRKCDNVVLKKGIRIYAY